MAVVQQPHRRSTRVPLAEVAALLQDRLSTRLTAYIAGVKSGKTVYRWAGGETTDVRYESERRLRTAYEIAQLLGEYESPETIRAWFIGLDPLLDDASPADAIHDGRLKEAIAAARAFVAGG